MTKQRRILYFASAVLLILVFGLCGWQMGATKKLPLSFAILSGDTVEQVELWESEDGTYYAFLPSYAELSQVEIILDNDQPVYINGKSLEDGMDCSAVAVNTPCELSYEVWGRMHHQTIVFLCSDNVAAMFIETQSGSLDYIHAEKGNKESGTISVYTPNGELDFRGELESIQGRGNFTWLEFEKKPYSLNLATEADLLSLGAAKNWVLLANADDPSHMRNKIVFDFADMVGMDYSPDSNWVDLYLNGEYVGLYLLSERNEVHPERVALEENGGILVSLERNDRLVAQNYPFVTTEKQQSLRIHYPKSIDEDGLIAIENVFQSVENAIINENGYDELTEKHLEDLIDVDSWARKYLIEEVFGSADACYISQFFYLNGASEEKKVFAGPVWDFDHSIGTEAAWQLVEPNTLYANRLQVKDGFDSPWFYCLYHKEDFYKYMCSVYKQDFLPALDTVLTGGVSSYKDQIQSAVLLDWARWDKSEYSLENEVDYICGFMRARMEFLSDIWIAEAEYNTVKLDHGFGNFYGYFVVYGEERFIELPVFEDTPTSHFLGWYYKDTNEPFDVTQPISEDIEIYAKWEDTESNKLDNVLKLIPLGIIAIIGIALLWTEYRRIKKSR